jgi:superfamily I DNA/RNA helicase
MIVANTEAQACEYDALKEIATEIYGDDEYRIEVMIHTTKEYVNKITQNNDLDLDELLIEINKELKDNKRFVDKINFDHLRRFMCEHNPDVNLLQTRVLEFLEAEVRDRKGL